MPKAKSFKTLSDPIKADPERRARSDRARSDAIAEIIEYQLDEVRKARNITQEQLAAALGTHQPNVSRLENGVGDFKVSTLRAYIEALGGRLEISAVFDGEDRLKLGV